MAVSRDSENVSHGSDVTMSSAHSAASFRWSGVRLAGPRSARSCVRVQGVRSNVVCVYGVNRWFLSRRTRSTAALLAAVGRHCPGRVISAVNLFPQARLQNVTESRPTKDAVAVTDYRIGASFSVSLSCLRAPARMFRSE